MSGVEGSLVSKSQSSSELLYGKPMDFPVYWSPFSNCSFVVIPNKICLYGTAFDIVNVNCFFILGLDIYIGPPRKLPIYPVVLEILN